MPAIPPQVSYRNGELTVIAKNSTLGDILRAVHEQTGAALDVPAGATDRVVGQMGPGSPRQVLSQLLNGTRFNYVILGSLTDSSKIARVILTPKPADTQQNATNAAPPPPARDDSAFNQGTVESDEDADTSETPVDQPPTQAPVRTPEQLLQELQRQQQLQQQQQQQTQPGTPAPQDRK